ncbi:MAG: PilZ domain-containing protein [Rhodopila sp.]
MDNGLRLPITRLKALIEPWIFQTVAIASDDRERRISTRYELVKPAQICGSGTTSGRLVTILNVSLTGAALRIPQKALNGWLLELSLGDEVSLSGLVAMPMDCWVIARDRDTLRVRFLPTPAAELQLQDLIGQLAGASPDSGSSPPGTGRRQIRKGFIVAAGILAATPAFAAVIVAVAPTFSTWTYAISPTRFDRRSQLSDVQATKQPDTAAFSRSAAESGRFGNELTPRPHAAAINATPSPRSELPPLPPDKALESPRLFLLSAGSEFIARIDAVTGSNGRAISAIIESNIYDARTGHLVLPWGTRLSGNYAERDPVNGLPARIVWKTGTLPDGRRLCLCAGSSVEKRSGDDVSDRRDDGEPSEASTPYLLSAYQLVAGALPSGEGLRNDDLRLSRPIQGSYAPLPGHPREAAHVIVRVHRDILLPAYGGHDSKPQAG